MTIPTFKVRLCLTVIQLSVTGPLTNSLSVTHCLWFRAVAVIPFPVEICGYRSRVHNANHLS